MSALTNFDHRQCEAMERSRPSSTGYGDEAIRIFARELDCFATLAMTNDASTIKRRSPDQNSIAIEHRDLDCNIAAGQPSGAGVTISGALGFLALLFCLGLAHALVALVVLAIVVAIVCWLASRQIGGQTGDVLGTVEQVSEIVILLVALR